jgi:tetratricopeptide (TPR) repeat protein
LSIVRFFPPLIITGSLLLQACAPVTPQSSVAEPQVEPQVEPGDKPELALNLPGEKYACVEQDVYDYTPLERGFTSLAAGEYIEAVQHFQRYQRLESSESANIEAGIGIAYISMLPASPFYDTEEARKSYRRLRQVPVENLDLHEQTLLMRQSLETFLKMERALIDLGNDNATLKKDLKKREEALKRLRELTLGQTGE